jgi:hypothetical protein
LWADSRGSKLIVVDQEEEDEEEEVFENKLIFYFPV